MNMKLNIRTEKVINVSDWDDFVKENYSGRPYDFQQQDGCKYRGNFYLTVPDKAEDYDGKLSADVDADDYNSEYPTGVSFADWLARDPKEPLLNQTYEWELELFWQRDFYPNIQMIANDLHERGLLEAGKYTINIDW